MSNETRYIECHSNQCKNINSFLPAIELPPGYELFSLTILSQILSRPDQSTFGPSSYFSDNLYILLFTNRNNFDMSGPLWDFIERYNDSSHFSQILKYSDFVENAANNIFNPEHQDGDLFKKAIFEQIFNRQVIRFYAVDKDEKIINKIQPPLAQNTIFYAKSFYINTDIPKAICIKKTTQPSSSFTPALEHVWTIYRENNKYSLYIRFFNSIYIPYRPSKEAVPVAVCYYPNTFINLIAEKFKRNKPSNTSLSKQNLISFPKKFNSNAIDKLLNATISYLESNDYTNLVQNETFANFIELSKLSAFNSSIFANYFLKNNINAHNFIVISIYPKEEWKKINPFLSNIKEYEYKAVKDSYSKFILWMMHAVTILRERVKANFYNALGLLTTTIPNNHIMTSLTYQIYKFYYYRCSVDKKTKTDSFVKLCSIGNSVFCKNVFYFLKNGVKVYVSDKNFRLDYGFDYLSKSRFTIPELINEFDTLLYRFLNSDAFSEQKRVNFSIDTDFIKSLLIPDVFSLISTKYNDDTP